MAIFIYLDIVGDSTREDSSLAFRGGVGSPAKLRCLIRGQPKPNDIDLGGYSFPASYPELHIARIQS